MLLLFFLWVICVFFCHLVDFPGAGLCLCLVGSFWIPSSVVQGTIVDLITLKLVICCYQTPTALPVGPVKVLMTSHCFHQVLSTKTHATLLLSSCFFFWVTKYKPCFFVLCLIGYQYSGFIPKNWFYFVNYDKPERSLRRMEGGDWWVQMAMLGGRGVNPCSAFQKHDARSFVMLHTFWAPLPPSQFNFIGNCDGRIKTNAVLIGNTQLETHEAIFYVSNPGLPSLSLSESVSLAPSGFWQRHWCKVPLFHLEVKYEPRTCARQSPGGERLVDHGGKSHCGFHWKIRTGDGNAFDKRGWIL